MHPTPATGDSKLTLVYFRVPCRPGSKGAELCRLVCFNLCSLDTDPGVTLSGSPMTFVTETLLARHI